VPKYYFEDFTPGRIMEFGGRTVSEAEIVAFARDYDPQSFHVDAAAAGRSPYGGLIASGWHTAALMMRMFCDHVLLDAASLGSPGMDELRWPKPVRPGDTLRVRIRVLEARPSQSRPEMGIVKSETEVLNQKDEVVMRMLGTGLYGRRPAA